ncbi:hypothetical protein M3Y95_00282700 [Aphelenchoides besseyi]|nr:hypothetical protein M3Y95_00282700 [Aphelenchoides besseyi]
MQMIARVAIGLLALAFVATAAPSKSEDTSNWGTFFQFYLPYLSEEFLLNAPRTRILAGPSSCFKQQMDYCQKGLNSDLGTTADIFKDPKSFAEVIASYYKKQTVQDGLLKLCSAQINFRNCLSVFYQKCTDALQILKNYQPISFVDAMTVSGIYDDIEFDCGGGLTEGLMNWDCIQKVNNNANFATSVQTCVDAYIKDATDPSKFCSAGKNFSICLSLAYQTAEPSCVNNDVKWWVCERSIRRVNLEGYCDDRCDDIFPAPPTKKPQSSVNPAAEFLEFVNNGGLFSDIKLKHFMDSTLQFKLRGASH